MKIEPFGKTPNGERVEVYTMNNASGAELQVTSYGGIIVALKLPRVSGELDDVVLGFDSAERYPYDPSRYFGALIGRYGNRIGKGHFALNGVDYQLGTNNGANHLHGGKRGFHSVVWEVRPIHNDEAAVELHYIAKDGEEGYPGNLTVTVRYTLTDAHELRIDYSATTDKDTIVNLTQHSYFNLAGHASGDILNHQLQLNASCFTPVDSGLIPTGELRSVQFTAFDFATPAAIGAHIDDDDEQLRFGKGYDHNWVLDGPLGVLKQAARIYEPVTQRVMEMWTTEPGVQFYSGNYLDSSMIGKGGAPYQRRAGFCLEAQHFPDSPNKPHFPSTVLRTGERYSTSTIYRFSNGDQSAQG